MNTATRIGVEELRQSAIEVLKLNDLGTMTSAAPNLYPHMWSWDAAFVAIGLARYDVPRAITELRTLQAAQWSTGMIPHIVFSENSAGYFPGFDRWGTASAAARPAAFKSSGICQPPVHAIAVRHIVDRGRENGGADQEAAEAFLAESFDGWLAWHRWLAEVRDPDGVGLIEIHHGWESGFDNSPRWDGPYSRINPGTVEPFTRRDTLHVADVSERPDDAEYTKYLWLVQQMASVDFDDRAVQDIIDFRVRDVFFSGIMAASVRRPRRPRRRDRPPGRRRGAARLRRAVPERCRIQRRPGDRAWPATTTSWPGNGSRPRRCPASHRSSPAASPRPWPFSGTCSRDRTGWDTRTCGSPCRRPPRRQARPSGQGPTGADPSGRS